MSAVDRDFAAEMRRTIDESAGQGDYLPRQLATEIVEKLRANDPELLAGWLDAQAEHFVWQMINDRDRSTRAHARSTSRANAFGDAAKAHKSGNGAPLRDFLALRFTVADGHRRALASLTAADLMFVGDSYERRERDNSLMKTLMRALAKKVGKRTVGDCYSNEQLCAMFDSFGSAAA